MYNFWFNNTFVYYKFLGLITKDGLKEKSEKILLDVFKQIDYFIFFEIIFKIKAPFRFYIKKRRIGRHSFKYYNSLVFILKEKQQLSAIRTFYLLLKSHNSTKRLYSFKQEHFISLVTEYIQNRGGVLILDKVKRYKQALFMRAVRHYRWK